MCMRAVLAMVLAAVVGTFLLVGVTGPVQAVEQSYPTLDRDPVGANDWTCRPTADRPYPAVMVHGTFGDRSSLLDALSSSLKADGYCVFSLDYGDRATGPIEDSAAELAGFVDQVLTATGAARVEMVGHSQGGMMPRYYIKYLGGDGRVEDLVGLSPSNHGTTVADAFGTPGCAACEQQMAGSAFLQDLNNPDETPGDVDYTQVVTRYDEVVVPYTSGFLSGDRSTNITLQDYCPADTADHVGIPMDRQAIAWVLEAFGHPGPADASAAIGCL
ncbi:MAG TPA: alpha/beta fold hydrolase [Nocardioidaceae bacterium]